jgi:hypothetical protein
LCMDGATRRRPKAARAMTSCCAQPTSPWPGSLIISPFAKFSPATGIPFCRRSHFSGTPAPCPRQREYLMPGQSARARTNGPPFVARRPCPGSSGAGGLDSTGSLRAGLQEGEGKMPTGIGPGRDSPRTRGAVSAAGATRTPPQSRAIRRRRRRMAGYVVLGLLEDRRFRTNAFIGIVTLVALGRLARESQVRARSRLAAWWYAQPPPARRTAADGRPAIDRVA